MAGPDTKTVLRVFLASPGDVAQERAFVRELLEQKLPNDPWLHHAVTFEVIAWDHPYGGTPMLATITPQEAVTRFTGRPADCDIVVVILWSRLGTHLDTAAHPKPGGGRYESGTEWEFEDAVGSARHPDILVFHHTAPVLTDNRAPGAIEAIRQTALVDAFLGRLKAPGGAFTGGATGYASLDDFKRLSESHLKRVISHRLGATPKPTPASTPAPTVPYPERCIGRSADTATIVAALLAGTQPTAVLVQGPGGIGKTTLTQETAHHKLVADRFATRRWFVELETATDRDTFDAQLLLALGLDPTQGFAAATAKLAQAPSLLILDNLETAWTGAPPAIEARLGALAAIPGLALLASFRGGAAIGGVRWSHRLTLTPLSEPDARDLFRDIAPTIPPTDRDLPNLLEALGGVPLAICLTARRAHNRTDLAALWAEWLRIGPDFAVQRGTDPSRLTSVPHSIALSLGSSRLGPDGHRLFALLGQCPAGLAAGDRAALLDDAAFAAEEGLTEVGLAFHRDGRLDLLPPVRDHARRACPPAPPDADHWCRHFLDRVRAEGGKILREGGAEALAALTPEVANIDAALRAAAALSLLPRAVAVLNGLYRLLSASGAGSPAVFAALADACAEAGDDAGQAECRLYHGVTAANRSDHDTARARYEEALPLYRRVGDVLGEANCNYALGDIALRRSDHDAARARYEEALPLYRRVGDVLGEANCIQSLGDIALRRSDHDAARARYEEALPLCRRVGDVLGEANCIRRLGDIALDRSDHDTARARYEEALPLFRRVGSVLGEANCIKSLGNIALDRSEHDTARARYEEALPLYRRVGDVQGEANCIKSLGDIAKYGSDHATARARYAEALPLYRRVGDVVGEANCLLGAGDLHRAQRERDAAASSYRAALALYGSVHHIGNAALAHEDLASVTDGAERDANLQTARDLYLSINLPDRAAQVG